MVIFSVFFNNQNYGRWLMDVAWQSAFLGLRQIRQITHVHLCAGQLWYVDRAHATQYFWDHPSWLWHIEKFFHHLHDQGVPVTYVDVCGRAFWPTNLVQHNISFSLQNPHEHSRRKGVKYYGDLFNSKDFRFFIRGLTKFEDCGRPALITLVPVSGLQIYGDCGEEDALLKQLTLRLFVKRFAVLLDILRPGGYLYVEPCFSSSDNLDHPVMLNLLSRYNCTCIKGRSDPYTNDASPYLIQKRADPDTPRL